MISLDNAILVGDFLGVAPNTSDESFYAMCSCVALQAKRNDVRRHTPKFWMALPSFDVVVVDATGSALLLAALDTCVLVSCLYYPNQFTPRGPAIHALSFWHIAVLVEWVERPDLAKHPIPVSAQVRFWHRCFFTQYLLDPISMLLPLERIDGTRASHVVIIRIRAATKVLSSTARWYTEVSKFLVNPLGVSLDYLRDVVTREPLYDVLLVEPISI